MQGAKRSDAYGHREHLQRRSAPVSRGQHRPDFSDSVDQIALRNGAYWSAAMDAAQVHA
jgi:hypothetical protein